MKLALSRLIAVVLALSAAAALAAGDTQLHHPHPSAAELVAAYRGAAQVDALKAIHSRVATGELERAPSGTSASEQVAPFKGKVELDWKEPGRTRVTEADASRRVRRITDGEHGWEVGTSVPRHELRVGERVELSRLGVLYQPALVLPLDELVYVRSDKVNGRGANVLQTKSGELLWLDQETNLPLRLDLLIERAEPSRAGEFYLSQVFFEDWRSLGTLQLPHTLRRVLSEATVTIHFNEIKQDVELSNGLFKIPYFWRQ